MLCPLGGLQGRGTYALREGANRRETQQKEDSPVRAEGGIQKRSREAPLTGGGGEEVRMVTDSEVIDRKAGNLCFCLFCVVPFWKKQRTTAKRKSQVWQG